ncbi:MAG: 50S ribosomal protein L13 [Erysipelotrichales bacterium]|nr:50S ribosomal protein L13 [Erysipelotrichales bacterium]
MRQTTMLKPSEVTRTWYIVDAAGLTLGRLATEVASVLRGKNKPTYTPNVDCGDYVIIVNADKAVVTGNKLNDKMYFHHSGYPGGFKSISMRDLKAKNPVRWVEKAVQGMLPHTKLGDVQRKHLYVVQFIANLSYESEGN